jgi:hypothetical protein
MLTCCVGENVLGNMLFVNISSFGWTTFSCFKASNKIQNSKRKHGINFQCKHNFQINFKVT